MTPVKHACNDNIVRTTLLYYIVFRRFHRIIPVKGAINASNWLVYLRDWKRFLSQQRYFDYIHIERDKRLLTSNKKFDRGHLREDCSLVKTCEHRIGRTKMEFSEKLTHTSWKAPMEWARYLWLSHAWKHLRIWRTDDAHFKAREGFCWRKCH